MTYLNGSALTHKFSLIVFVLAMSSILVGLVHATPVLDKSVNAGGSNTFSITTANANEVIVVASGGYVGYIPSVTVDGNVATMQTIGYSSAGGGPGEMSLFSYLAPNAGTHNIAVNENGMILYPNVALAIENVNSTGIISNSVIKSSGCNVAPSVDLSLNPGTYFVVGAAHYNTGSGSAGTFTWTGSSPFTLTTTNSLHQDSGDDVGVGYAVFKNTNSPLIETVAGADSVATSGTACAGVASAFPDSGVYTNPTVQVTNPANSIAEVGQYVSSSATITGGSSPYSYNWIVSNSITKAVISNTLYTGVSSTSNDFTYLLGSNDVGQTEVINVIVTDTTSNTANSIYSSSFSVNSALTVPSITPSSAVTLDAGQSTTITANVASGGVSPYTYNFIVFNAVTHVIIANQLGSSSSFAFASNSNLAGNMLKANVIVTDSATSNAEENSINSASIYINSALSGTPTISPNSPTINSGQSVTLYESGVGGGTGPYTYNWFTGTACQNLITGEISNSISVSPSSNTAYSVNVMDSATTPTNSVCSAVDTVTVNQITQPSSSGGGGPSKRTFILSDNINSTLVSQEPVVVIYSNGQKQEYYQNQMPVSYSTYSSSINFSFACSVAVNGETYTSSNDFYGIGFVPCGQVYTIYGGSVEAIYSITSKETTSTTTTVAATTTILPKSVIINGSDVNFIYNSTVSGNSTYLFDFNDSDTVLNVTLHLASKTRFRLSVINVTSNVPLPSSNAHIILGLNITVSPTNNVTISQTTAYNCSLPESSLSVYILKGGNWSMVNNFSVNHEACTVMFSVPADPIVEILSNYTGSNPTVATTTMPATTILSNTKSHGLGGIRIITITAITVIVLVLLLVIYLYKNKKRRRRWKF